MVEQLLEKGYDCVVTTDTNEQAVARMKERGARGTMRLDEMTAMLTAPRVVWLRVPRGAVEKVLQRLVPLLETGDTIIEGGNTYYEDTMRRAKDSMERGIRYVDVGVSGGVSGARHGACMMVGGARETFVELEPLFADACVSGGYGYMGASGAGHFVKMVHNAIEYGMMGAIAEGLEALRARESNFGIDVGEVIKVYGHGSIIESRLVSEWLAAAWEDSPQLRSFDGTVPYGETEEEMEALETQAVMNVLKAARAMRVETREEPSFRGQVINALRKYFGGHTSETASKNA